MKKPVDFEGLPMIMHTLMGIPMEAISVVNAPVRRWSGVQITSKSGTMKSTFWYGWEDCKIRTMEVFQQ